MKIRINSDISRYRPTFLGSASARNIIVVSIMAIVGVVSMVFTYPYLLPRAQMWLLILLEAPIAAFFPETVGAYGLPMEKVIKVFFADLLTPKNSECGEQEEYKEPYIMKFLIKNKYRVPRYIQDFIPLDTFYEDGICQYNKKFSMVYYVSNLDFSNLSKDDKNTILFKFETLLASFTEEANYQISVISNNRTAEEIYELIKTEAAANDVLASSMNSHKWAAINSRVQLQIGIYLTVTTVKPSIEDAREFFRNCEVSIDDSLRSMDSQLKKLNLKERLNLYHRIYHQNSMEEFFFSNLGDLNGNDIRSCCCPSSWEKHPTYLKIDERYFRTMYLQDIGSGIEDNFFSSLANKIPKLCIASIDIKPLTEETTNQMINRTVAFSRQKINQYKKSKARQMIIDDYLPPVLQQENEASLDVYASVTERDQRLASCNVTLLITADTLEELELNTKIIKEYGRSQSVTISSLTNQQIPGLYSTVPFGMQILDVKRVLTTESIAAFIPFTNQSIQSFGKQATWIGVNPITGNVNSINRANLLNGNGLIYGVSGSGKSVQTKLEIIERRYKEPFADIIILDPSAEYISLAKELKGTTINVSVSSKDRINLMDISDVYSVEGNSDPIRSKVSFLQEVVNVMCEGEIPIANVRAIVDRCATTVYKPLKKSFYQSKMPTLIDLYNEIKKQPEEYAQQIAVIMEPYVSGSLNIFAEETNTSTDPGLTVFNFKELDKNLKTYANMVVIDQIFNRISRNLSENRWTYIYIDEIHTFFGTAVEPLIMTLWKMGRKSHCYSTGITQQIQDLLESSNGQKIVGNSEFVQILKCDEIQITEDLTRILDIPPMLTKFIRGEKYPEERIRRSTGIIKYAGSIIPFESEIKPGTALYELINTD